MQKQELIGLTESRMGELFRTLGEPSYRGREIFLARCWNKVSLLLILTVFIVLAGSPSAFAQLFCLSYSSPVLVNPQGTAELMGSVVLDCKDQGGNGVSGASITLTLLPASAVVTNDASAPPTMSTAHAAGVAGTVSGNHVSFPVPVLPACSGCSHTLVIGIDPSAPAGSTVGVKANVVATGVTFPGQIQAFLTTSSSNPIVLSNPVATLALPVPGTPTVSGGGTSSVVGQLSCTTNSTPVLANPQGNAELMGSIILSCTEANGASAIPGAGITALLSPAAAVITNSLASPPTISLDHAAGVGGTVSGNVASFHTPAIPACSAAAGCSHIFVIGIDPSAPAGSTLGIQANVVATGVTSPSQIAAVVTMSPTGVIAITNNFLNVAIPVAGTPTASGGGTSSVEGELFCSSSSTPTNVDSQGTADIMGSIILDCTEAGGAPAISGASITVLLSPATAVPPCQHS